MSTTENTTTQADELPKQLCRAVTPDEIAHIKEYGWVKLKGFVKPDVIAAMLGLAKSIMGDDGDSNPLSPFMEQALAEGKEGLGYFNAQRGGGLDHPLMARVIHEVGLAAKDLQARPSPEGGLLDVRYYSDFFVPKLPAASDSKHGGNGATAFHQDFITFSVDRSGGMTFWFALEAYDGSAGTMSFVDGSHKVGVMGDYTTYGDGDALDAFPELGSLHLTDPMTYEAGDITVHTHFTIHGAGENVMDRPRWAYFIVTQPADACWNGSPCPNFDHSEMVPWEPLGDERFPIISRGQA